MRKQNSDYQTSNLSEVGTQLENRDYHGYVELDDFACWVVADGIDEVELKKSAELVVKGVLAAFTEKPGISKRHLKEYLNTAHRVLKRESVKSRLKASVMIVVSDYMSIRYAHAGNVRLQVISGNEMTIISEDHSYYQQKIDDGTYPMNRSTGFEERNNLINYAGIQKGFNTSVSKKYKLKQMDTLLITTVGFWEHITPIELVDGLEETKEPKEVTDNLENQLLSKHAKDLNNYTIVAIFVNKLFLKETKIWKTIKKVLLIALPILLILGLWLFMRHRNRQNQIELTDRVIQYKLNGNDYISHDSFVRALDQYNLAIALLPQIRTFDEEEILRLSHRITQLIVDGNSSVEREDFERARRYYVRARDYLIDDGEQIPIFTNYYILTQISYTDTRIHIEELISLGDLQVSLGQYGRALDTYRAARTIAIGLSNLSLMQRLNISVDTAQSLYDGAAQARARAEAREVLVETQNKDLSSEELAQLFEDIASIYDAAGLNEEAANMRVRAETTRNDASEASIFEQRQLANELEASGDVALLAGNYETALAYYQAAERIFRSINSEFNITLIGQKVLAVSDLIRARDERERQAPVQFGLESQEVEE